MRAKAPCLNCSDREVGCHSTCERYKQFKNEHSAETQVRNDFLKGHNEHVSFMREQKTRRERNHR